jgi:CHAT domain-containing protein
LVLSQPEALGRAPTLEDDGILQAWEIIEGVRVNAELVVLSACQTGLGEHIRGEGLMGLTRAFLYAGARTVAVSLWDISDAGTADFMMAFYQQVRDGSSTDVALQQAMIAARRDPARKDPFYWAPFILVGDWK